MIHDFVIIGGGMAGLAAALRLTELGAKPLVIEGGEYPSHKVCGEFFSPESLSILKKWGVDVIPIHEANFHVNAHVLNMPFPSPAGSLSHYLSDPFLSRKATTEGATLLTNTKVDNLQMGNESHELTLSTGEKIKAKSLIIAAGRLFSNPSPQQTPQYCGIKAHFEGKTRPYALEMFSFPGAYVGVSPIEQGKYNVACIARWDVVHDFPSVSSYMDFLRSDHPRLSHYLAPEKMVFKQWMSVPVPSFGIKKTPDWDRCYFIGDAAGTIPPASGDGLSMALFSGILAAEYAFRNDPRGFKKAWHKQYASPIFWGKVLNQLLLRPAVGDYFIKIGNRFPQIAQWLFKKTRCLK